MKRTLIYLLLCLLSFPVWAAWQPEFSTAGFFRLNDTGREVYSMNPAWRFYKGAAQGAEAVGYDDREWTVVSLPDGIEYLPTEASGCINYQGEVWNRKHFTPDAALKGKKLFLHFEGIMGKSKVFVNGKLLTEHFGGYLPVVTDVTDVLDWNGDNVVSVWADNSDDPAYPPGKAQDVLDFAYFGGIYRDCWLVAHNNLFITDPNYENETAGGGLFVAYDKVSDASADILLKLQVRNATKKNFSGVVEYELLQPDGKRIALQTNKVQVKAGKAATTTNRIQVKQPMLWAPSSPTLYNLQVRVRDNQGNVVDGYRRRIGIRSLEFKGVDGFWLNGKPYEKPLIGVNLHQDFAVVGNAVANSIHWRDAKKLKDIGLDVVRNAHCPQDPAFMDACDELGLFVIVNTPGWQFWNEAPEFAQRVYGDIRNLVRRDRNHPCVWLWEPILNETWYPADFAKNTRDVVDAEYPYPSCYCGSDSEARGHENFPVHFAHPANMQDASKETDPTKTYFTREWGDNVDDWNSHNSPSRVARNWGEYPMRVQAMHYANPTYPVTNYDVLYRQQRQHIGGCLWHSFDHQRGYHPDPFYGGLMDVFRQPKYSYYLFMAQRPAAKSGLIAETGPMVHIAHEMTPFSGKDVTVYSNCDEVRLTFTKGGKTWTYKKDQSRGGMPSPIITFPDVYDFMVDKALSRQNKQADVYLYAEGLIDGKVVATHKAFPSRRPEKLLLWVDNEGTDLKADGSDFVTVVAAVTDKAGNIKRLNNYFITFGIEGEGRILGGSDVMANPAPVKWGEAPVLVQSTLKPGKIKVTASVLFEGSQMPLSAELLIDSKPASVPLVYNADEAARIPLYTASGGQATGSKSSTDREQERLLKEMNALKLKEVERQQTDFGEKSQSSSDWKLVWEDNFDQPGSFDEASWSKIPRGSSDWNRRMSDYDSCYAMRDGNLVLRGIVNPDLQSDTARYITGGVYSKGKVGFSEGRVSIRARLHGAKGAWPAIWMLPEGEGWPQGGEIDIMERLNNNSIAYQTVHSSYTHVLGIKDNPRQGSTGIIDKNDYNVYSVEMYNDSLVFYINENRTFAYPRIQTDKEGQFPFTGKPFYLLIDMQLGGSWVGDVDMQDLPVEMEIDWVRFFKKEE